MRLHEEDWRRFHVHNLFSQINYSVALPEGTTAADVDKVKAASTSGGTGASTFAASLRVAVNTEIAASSDLSALGIIAKSAIVTGTASSEVVVVSTTPHPKTSGAFRSPPSNSIMVVVFGFLVVGHGMFF